VDNEVTLPMVDAVFKRWQRVPPLSMSVSAIVHALGGKTTSEEKKDKQDFHEIQSSLAGLGFVTGSKPEWLTEPKT